MIRTATLPFGARLATESMAESRSVSLGFWVGTGSRDETAEQAGLSHVLEHLLFKGTAERSSSAIAEVLDEVGGDCNAYTTKEYTAFYIRLLAEHLDLGLDILSDIMWRPALRPGDLDAERLVILDEILMHQDEPADAAVTLSSELVFPGHPLGREVLGTEASVSAFEADDVRAFFDHHYRPGNLVVAAAGALGHDEVADGLVARYRGPAGGAAPLRQPPGARTEPLGVVRRSTEQAHLVVAVRAVDRHDDRRYALSVVDHVLGGGLSSRLFQEIRERRGLAYSVWSEFLPYADTGTLTVGVATAPEHVPDVLGLIGESLAAVADSGVTERELAIAKGNLRADTLLAHEDPASRMGRLGAGLLFHGTVLTVDEQLERVERVTLEDVAEVAAVVLGGDRTLSVVGPFDPDRFDASPVGIG